MIPARLSFKDIIFCLNFLIFSFELKVCNCKEAALQFIVDKKGSCLRVKFRTFHSAGQCDTIKKFL
jgi:hypothetical protein